MSGSLNKVMLIGNLGKDPEVRTFERGGMLVKFPLATSETFTNREGQRTEQTEWHNIVVRFKGLAEICEKYLRKGSKIFLEGKIRTRQWEENGTTRYITEILMESMTMLDSRPDSGSSSRSGSFDPPAREKDSDLPF